MIVWVVRIYCWVGVHPQYRSVCTECVCVDVSKCLGRLVGGGDQSSRV